MNTITVVYKKYQKQFSKDRAEKTNSLVSVKNSKIINNILDNNTKSNRATHNSGLKRLFCPRGPTGTRDFSVLFKVVKGLQSSMMTSGRSTFPFFFLEFLII